MLTKMMAAIVMTGALWVAGDAAYQKFDFGAQPKSCCLKKVTPDCCSTGSSCCEVSRKSCCTSTANARCCDAAYVYCTLTGEIYQGCCCIIVDGRDFCLATNTFVDECCCIPLPD